MLKKERIEWIVVLKTILCISIIMLHLVSGWINNVQNYKSSIRLFWCDSLLFQFIFRFDVIPCFVMISGFLLLNPKKEFNLKKYLIKVLAILGIFGFGYCVIENIYNMGFSNIPKLLISSLYNLIQGKSWDHMWYLYTLIGLYIMTPILKYFVEKATQKDVVITLTFLFICSSLIPTINTMFNLNIITFGLYELRFVFMYLLGYYVVDTNIISNKLIYILGIIGILGTIIFTMLGFISIYNKLHMFVLFSGMFIIRLFSSKKIKIKANKFFEIISKYSLGIYIVHPIFINILFKVLHIYPDIFPIFIGEFIFIALVLFLSLLLCFILYRLPVFKRIFN